MRFSKARTIIWLFLFTALIAGGMACSGSSDDSATNPEPGNGIDWQTGQITKNSYEDSFPQIKGDYLVWQGHADGDWEIFLCDTATKGSPIFITHNDYDDISPQTDGNYVVWLGYSHSGGEIFVYDILSGETTRVTDDDNVDSPPQIANGVVVWTSHKVTDSVEPGEIMLYDIATGVTEQLTMDALDDSGPRISSEAVIWVQTDEELGATIFIHDLGTGTTVEAPQDFVWENSPQTDGNLTVLARYDYRDREIFLYDTGLKVYEQITDNDLDDRYPRISGNKIVWIRGEGKASEIFFAFSVPDE
ncbi:MAG: hypothetical protein BA872_01930 [Desulfobacterales bacterium C00003060]|nr:MAG: hypothetical protein BA872_01930 [Desulfobacterales bacterium C00003060]OEU80066.1 MAG: hypothetical protein BA865_02450 [Desulfobacterales bacterium S5133MH4]